VLVHKEIVVFANDWAADPTSKHQLIRRLAATNDVLWIESAGMRTPKLSSASDLRRIATKARSFFSHSRKVTDRLHVYAPPAVPLPHVPAARAVNAQLYNRTLRREMHRIGMSDESLLWIYVPHVAPLIRRLPRRGLVYHCVDLWSAFEGFDPTLMTKWEAEICERADVVFASARDLADRCARYNSNVHYVPHGVEHSHFATALNDGALPDDIRDLPGPRVGFFGLIQEWVDVDLIGQLADRLPYTFVLIGTADRDLSALTRRRNVVHLGRRPYADLPAYCRGFDAAIVPFRASSLTQSVNPIKLREYAAAGLPIVSSDLPEVRRCGDIAHTARTVDEWVAELTKAVASAGDLQERRRQSARVQDQDWSAVTRRVGDLVQQSLDRRPIAGKQYGMPGKAEHPVPT
jgi:glycosyltransferase involved in cell wall biosynthesis